MPGPKVILSLCDYSGQWVRPYRYEGYRVYQVDPKLTTDFHAGLIGETVQSFRDSDFFKSLCDDVHGIFMAPPCTDFSVSGAQYWPEKDEDGRTDASLAIVDACLAIKDACPSLVWWVLENPVGRLPKLRVQLGKPAVYVHPHYYAGFADDPESERYTKKTGLWGVFNHSLPRAEREPVRVCDQGSWIQKLGGKSERTKELRSMTPTGFARAFYTVNP